MTHSEERSANMIRNEAEYQAARDRIDEERSRFQEHAESLSQQGYTADEIRNLMQPLESFHRQLVEEVESYERLKRGQFKALENLHGLGQTLIGLRIARGMTQRELAERLGVDASQVSRDERNEYHGVSVDRAMRILDALEVRLISHVDEVEPLRPSPASAEEPTPA